MAVRTLFNLVLSLPLLTILGSLSFLFLTILVVNEFIRYNARHKDFNGPPGRPLIGNLFDIAVNAPEVFRAWSLRYGDVYQIQLGNTPILVVNSAEAAKELFDCHAHALSSRPELYTFHKIVSTTAGSTIGMSPMSDSLKRRKRAAAVAMNKPTVAKYAPYLDWETSAFVKSVLEAGQGGKAAIDPVPLIQRFALSVALTVNYGTRIASHKDELFREIVEVERGINSIRSRTENLTEYIPLLRWIPLTASKQKAKELRRRRDAYLDEFDSALRQQIEEGTHQPSIQANAILNPETKLSREELTSISISIISGGTDTVANTVSWAIAFLGQHPDIQERALAAIRETYGVNVIDRSTADNMNCAYIAAMVREFLRFFTVVRLSLPRKTIRDIVYDRQFIRKGSTIWLNAWACNIDPEVWQDPLNFRPERWIEQPDAPVFPYGLGYRKCVGSHLANQEMYTLFMRLISCFEIVTSSDVDVSPITGSVHISDGGRAPRPYKVLFKPRNTDTLKQAIEERGKDMQK